MTNELYKKYDNDSNSYTEDQWTARLCIGLKHNGIKCTCYAHLRGYSTKEAWQGRVHESVDDNCFVFQGAPDLIISKVDEDEVVLSLGCDDDGMDKEDRMEDSDASSNSSDSWRIEMGFQMPPTRPYKAGSIISDKVGELVGAIHMAMVAREIRSIRSGRVTSDEITGRGLFISKTRMMDIVGTKIADGSFSARQLCSAVKYLTGAA